MTLGLLIGALLVGLLGIFGESHYRDYHLIVESLAVAAGITGVFAERRAAAVERQQVAVGAVRKELEDNIYLLQDDSRFQLAPGAVPGPRLYPRIGISATDACLAQDALAGDGDDNAAGALATWREEAETFNRGLNLTELLFYGLLLSNLNHDGVMERVDSELQTRRRQMVVETETAQCALNRQPR
ncbi:MAG: hypothetical protein ACJ76B_06340 [Solirubrobacterales bacterium]